MSTKNILIDTKIDALKQVIKNIEEMIETYEGLKENV